MPSSSHKTCWRQRLRRATCVDSDQPRRSELSVDIDPMMEQGSLEAFKQANSLEAPSLADEKRMNRFLGQALRLVTEFGRPKWTLLPGAQIDGIPFSRPKRGQNVSESTHPQLPQSNKAK